MGCSKRDKEKTGSEKTGSGLRYCIRKNRVRLALLHLNFRDARQK